MHVAAGLGQLEILKALADKGADLNLADYRGDSPIFWAERQGHEEIIKYLLAQGVQTNQQNKARLILSFLIINPSCRYHKYFIALYI